MQLRYETDKSLFSNYLFTRSRNHKPLRIRCMRVKQASPCSQVIFYRWSEIFQNTWVYMHCVYSEKKVAHYVELEGCWNTCCDMSWPIHSCVS